VRGIVDVLIATGKQHPKKPYFCLHEYKRERNVTNDPFAQTLIAMVVMQQLNQDGKPIYGVCVAGHSWNFFVLEGNEYGLSLAFDATKDELFDIFAILWQFKVIIERLQN